MDDLTLHNLYKRQFLATEKIAEAIELNTEKLQELLERVECIDNQFDELKQGRGVNEQATANFHKSVLNWLEKLHLQGTP